MLPDNLKFTKDHEWIKIEGDEITLGITDYAQGELGDIIFVELPQIGETFNQGDTVGTIEAVKTVADIYIPIDGEVISINSEIEDSPELVNSDPFEKGWLVKIKSQNLNDSELLYKEEYAALIKWNIYKTQKQTLKKC